MYNFGLRLNVLNEDKTRAYGLFFQNRPQWPQQQQKACGTGVGVLRVHTQYGRYRSKCFPSFPP